MTNKNNQSHGIGRSRRKYLASVGMATLAIAGTNNVVAGKSSAEKFEESLKLRRENDWNVDTWHNYLEGKGIEFGNNTEQHEITEGPAQAEETAVDDDSELEPQLIGGFDPDELKLTMTYARMSDYDSVTLDWEFDHSVGSARTGVPKDPVTIGFEPSDFDRPREKRGSDQYEFGSEYTTLISSDSYGPGGVGAQYDGQYIDTSWVPVTDGEIGGDTGLNDWMTLYLELDANSYEDADLYFGYDMLWDDASISGVSLGTGGVSVSIQNESDSWDEPVSLAYSAEDLFDGREEWGG